MIELFMLGFFFGLVCGACILALHNTTKELDETNRIISQIQIRDDLINRQRETIKALKTGAHYGKTNGNGNY